jgi:hypothetical protein
MLLYFVHVLKNRGAHRDVLLGLFREGYGAAIVVGEDYYGLSVKSGIKRPFTGYVEGVTIN